MENTRVFYYPFDFSNPFFSVARVGADIEVLRSLVPTGKLRERGFEFTCSFSVRTQLQS